MTAEEIQTPTVVVEPDKPAPPKTPPAGLRLLELVQATLVARGWRRYRVDTLQHPGNPDWELRHHFSGGTWQLILSHLGPQGDGVRPTLDRRVWQWTAAQAEEAGQQDVVDLMAIEIPDEIARYVADRGEVAAG